MIDLREYVCRKGRAHIDTPWRACGWSWASDGVVLVGIAGEDHATGSGPPEARGLCDWATSAPVRSVDIGSLRSFIGTAKRTDTVRNERTPCEECDGEGVRLCNMGHEHDCDWCYGLGHVGPTEQVIDHRRESYVRIAGQIYDRQVVAVGLTALDGVTDDVGMTYDPQRCCLLLRADGLAVVMARCRSIGDIEPAEWTP